MKLKFTKMAAAVCIVFLNANAASGSSGQLVGSYDFSYMTTGSLRASPVQVFDDGRNTYFQFRAGEAIPAIFTQQNGSMQLLVPLHEGPYVKVEQVHGQFTLQLGRAQAMVVHGAGTRLDAPPIQAVAPNGMTAAYHGGEVRPGTRVVASLAPSAPALVDDALERNSYATPTRGDRVGWVAPEKRVQEHVLWFPKGSHTLGPMGRKLVQGLARSTSASGRFVVMGRDDESLKEGLEQARADAMRDALVAAGVGRDRISTKIGIAGKRDKNLWESNIRVEVESEALVATSRTVPSPAANSDARGNIQSLIRSGVLTLDQGNALLARSGSQASPSTQVAPQVEVPPGGFRMVAADKTVQTTIRRWATSVNYTVVWEVPADLDAQVSGDAIVQAGSIKEAVERLLASLRQAGYSLDATFYSNRVVRFTASVAQSQDAPPVTAPAARPVRNDPTPQKTRENLLHQAVTGGVPIEASGRKWSMRADDKSIEQMLSRWGRDSHWSVVWNAKESVPIAGDAVVEMPTFLTAADYVIAQATKAGYQMRAVAYANNTLVVSSY